MPLRKDTKKAFYIIIFMLKKYMISKLYKNIIAIMSYFFNKREKSRCKKIINH